MIDSTEEYLSADVLRDKLYKSLRSRGFVNDIKKHIRSSLVTELQQVGANLKQGGDGSTPEKYSLMLQAANSLVADHMLRCCYDYSLSIFLPECDLTPQKLMSLSDILQLLRIGPNTQLHKNLISSSTDEQCKGLLFQLLTELCSQQSQNVNDQGCQTDQCPAFSSIDDKLLSVDKMYSSMSRRHSQLTEMSLDDRILSYQRKLDIISKEDVKLQVETFKKKETSRIRREERDSLLQEFQLKKQELERNYSDKMNLLRDKEKNLTQQLHREYEIQSKELLRQRQVLLNDIDAVRQREAAARNKELLLDGERKMNEERLKTREDVIEKRASEVQQKLSDYNARLTNEMAQFRMEEQAKNSEFIHKCEVRERKLKEDEKILKEEQDLMNSSRREISEKFSRFSKFEIELHEIKDKQNLTENNNAVLRSKLKEMTDYWKIKEKNVVLEHELQSLKTRLAKFSASSNGKKTKHDEDLKENEQTSAFTISIQQELQGMKDSLQHERILHQQTRINMESQLKEELNRKKELMFHLEQQVHHQRELQQEVQDLRSYVANLQAASHDIKNTENSKISRYGSQKCLEASLDDDSAHFQPNTGPLIDLNLNSNPVYRFHAPIAPIKLPYSYSERFDTFMDTNARLHDTVTDTKSRLQALDNESQNLQKAYDEFEARYLRPAQSQEMPRKVVAPVAKLISNDAITDLFPWSAGISKPYNTFDGAVREEYNYSDKYRSLDERIEQMIASEADQLFRSNDTQGQSMAHNTGQVSQSNDTIRQPVPNETHLSVETFGETGSNNLYSKTVCDSNKQIPTGTSHNSVELDNLYKSNEIRNDSSNDTKIRDATDVIIRPENIDKFRLEENIETTQKNASDDFEKKVTRDNISERVTRESSAINQVTDADIDLWRENLSSVRENERNDSNSLERNNVLIFDNKTADLELKPSAAIGTNRLDDKNLLLNHEDNGGEMGMLGDVVVSLDANWAAREGAEPLTIIRDHVDDIIINQPSSAHLDNDDDKIDPVMMEYMQRVQLSKSNLTREIVEEDEDVERNSLTSEEHVSDNILSMKDNVDEW